MDLKEWPEEHLTDAQRIVLMNAVDIVQELINKARVSASANERRDLGDAKEILENGRPISRA